MINNELFFFKLNYRFYKGHPLVSISSGLNFFCLSQNMIHKICKSEEKQMIWDIIIIAYII